MNKSYILESILKLHFCSPVNQLYFSGKQGDETRAFYAIEVPTHWKLDVTLVYKKGCVERPRNLQTC